VADRILPAIRCCLEVREVLGHEIVDLTDGKASGFTVLKSHEDEDAVGVDRFGEEWLVPISAGLGCNPLVWIVSRTQVGYRVAAATW
jgi:hypothetical protein